MRNKEEIAEHRKKYLQANREKTLVTRRKYYIRNKKQIKESNKKWYKANREKVAASHKK